MNKTLDLLGQLLAKDKGYKHLAVTTRVLNDNGSIRYDGPVIHKNGHKDITSCPKTPYMRVILQEGEEAQYQVQA